MKALLALPLAFAISTLILAPSAMAQTKGVSKKPTIEANAWGELPTPHHRDSGMSVNAKRGESVFTDHCALCHGLSGKGDGPRSAFFVPGQQYIADLSNADFIMGHDEQFLTSIREGLRRFPEPAYVMPQFKYILSDEEIRSALAYIKTLPSRSKK